MSKHRFIRLYHRCHRAPAAKSYPVLSLDRIRGHDLVSGAVPRTQGDFVDLGLLTSMCHANSNSCIPKHHRDHRQTMVASTDAAKQLGAVVDSHPVTASVATMEDRLCVDVLVTVCMGCSDHGAHHFCSIASWGRCCFRTCRIWAMRATHVTHKLILHQHLRQHTRWHPRHAQETNAHAGASFCWRVVYHMQDSVV